jgi:hypothetical protein
MPPVPNPRDLLLEIDDLRKKARKTRRDLVTKAEDDDPDREAAVVVMLGIEMNCEKLKRELLTSIKSLNGKPLAKKIGALKEVYRKYEELYVLGRELKAQLGL